MHGLYERQLGGRSDADIAASLLAGNDDEETREAVDVDRAYFDDVWGGVTREYTTLLDTIAPHVDRSVEALSPIERGLLVIGAWELAHRPDVPYRAIIDEAVELAKAYGGTDGYKFVNGVLDKLAARLRVAEIRAQGA